MIKLGNHSYCYGMQRGAANNVNVGNYSCIAEGVIFDGGFNHNPGYISTFPFSSIWSDLPSNILIKGDITIGNDVWIGEDAIIMSGVTIADGAIIGARTIVTKDVDAYEVIVGAPMRVIKKRFTIDQIKKLLEIKWWDWPNEKVRENVKNLQADDISAFIHLYHKI